METESRIISLEGRVAALESRVAVTESDIKNITKTLDKIDNNTTWLLRIMISAIVVALLGLVITNPIL